MNCGTGEGYITATGAKIQGSDVDLWASQNINLLASTNQSETHSHNSGASVGGGVTVGLGQQNGISFQANAQISKGRANGTETTYDNTQILASNNFTLYSGKDTNLQGAQINAKHIDADIQGNLNILTLQDTSDYESKQSSVGGSVSLCIPPICYGQVATASITVSQQDINHNYQSAMGQSGFFAGEGGYDIHVKGNTHLTGGAIASVATDPALNNLSTASLTYTDLDNTEHTHVSDTSVSVSYSSNASLLNNATNAVGSVVGTKLNDSLFATNQPSGQQSGRTQSVITGNVTLTGTGNAALDAQSQSNAATLTTRDASTANGALTNTLKLAADLQTQKENARAAQLVGSVTTNAIGDLSVAAGWKEGSLEKTALHGLAGLIEAKVAGGNLLAGAASGAINEQLVAAMSDYLVNTEKMDKNSPEFSALMKAGSSLVGTAVGALASGGDAKTAAMTGNIAVTATTNNFLSHLDRQELDNLRNKKHRTSAEDKRLVVLEASDQMSDGLLDKYRSGQSLSSTEQSNLSIYLGSYLVQEGPQATSSLIKNGSPHDYTYPYAGSGDMQQAYMDKLRKDSPWGILVGSPSSDNREQFNLARIDAGLYLNTNPNESFLPSSGKDANFTATISALQNSAAASLWYLSATEAGVDPKTRDSWTNIISGASDIGTAMVLPKVIGGGKNTPSTTGRIGSGSENTSLVIEGGANTAKVMWPPSPKAEPATQAEVDIASQAARDAEAAKVGGIGANTALVESEVSALERIAANNRAGSPAADLRSAYQQAKGQVDFAHIEADVRFNFAGGLQKAQGGHFSTSPLVDIIPGSESVGANGSMWAKINLQGPDGNWYLKTNNNGFSSLTPETWSLARAKGEMSRAFLGRTQLPNGNWVGSSSGVDFRFYSPTKNVPLWRGFPEYTP